MTTKPQRPRSSPSNIAGPKHLRIAQDTLHALLAARPESRLAFPDRLTTYPAYVVVLTYALGLTRAERWSDLRRWLEAHVFTGDGRTFRIIRNLFMQAWGGFDGNTWRLWPGTTDSLTPWADHLVEAIVPWSCDLGMTRSTALENYHLLELLGGLVALAEQDTERLAVITRPVYFPSGQTMSMRLDEDDLFRRVGLLENRDALLAAGFCRGTVAHWDASIRAMELVSAREDW